MIRPAYFSRVAFLSLSLTVLYFFPVYACDFRCQEEKLKHSSQALLKNFDDIKAREFFRSFAVDPKWVNSKYQMRVMRINELLEYIDLLQKRVVTLEQNRRRLKQSLDKNFTAGTSLEEWESELRNKRNTNISLPTPPEKESVDYLKNFLAQKKDRLVDIVRILQKENDFLKEAAAIRPRQKISVLTDQLAGKTLELIEKDSLLAEQKENFQSLENSLEEAQERLNLVQHIIQEKDQRIQVLEKDVTQMQALTQQGYEINQKNIEDLKTQFVQLHDDLSGQMAVNDDKITALENLLAEQEKRLARYAMEMRVKSKHIGDLTDRLQKKNKALVETNFLMESQDRKIVELDGIIQIYKSKLSETNQILREKVEKIRSLETQSVDLWSFVQPME